LNLVAILTAILNNILPALFKYLLNKKHYLVLLGALSILLVGIFIVSYYFYDNSNFDKSKKFNEANKLVVDMLKRCGEGSAISLGIVSTQENIDQNNNVSYDGSFVSAFAYSSRNNGIVSLKTPNSIYDGVKPVDIATYNLFLRLGNSFPESFDLSNMNSIDNYPSLYKFLKTTDWGIAGTLKRIYLTSIITDVPAPLPKKVIFVISFSVNNDFLPKEGCFEIKEDLRTLKEEIKKL